MDVALTSNCGLLNVTHTVAAVQVLMSTDEQLQHQSGRLSNMATTYE